MICCWQVLRERLRISGTNVHLVHDSSDTPGFQSVLFIALTLNSVPDSLFLIRLRIVVEGVVFEKDFEADVRLQYRFAWDRRNAYNQKVYGVATATGLYCLKVSLSYYVFWCVLFLIPFVSASKYCYNCYGLVLFFSLTVSLSLYFNKTYTTDLYCLRKSLFQCHSCNALTRGMLPSQTRLSIV